MNNEQTTRPRDERGQPISNARLEMRQTWGSILRGITERGAPVETINTGIRRLRERMHGVYASREQILEDIDGAILSALTPQLAIELNQELNRVELQPWVGTLPYEEIWPKASTFPTGVTSVEATTNAVGAEWLRILASQTGVGLEAVPPELRAKLCGTADKAEINKGFFEWFNNRPTPQSTLTEADKDLFKTFTSVENSIEYRNAKARYDDAERSATRRQNEIIVIIQNMMREVDEMRKLKRENPTDLTPQIEEILADNWYKYDPERTQDINALRSVPDRVLVFRTPRVNMAFYNKEAGVEMNVDMGSYTVEWCVQQGYIKVREYEDNIKDADSDEYIHPHVDSSGGVCWGNAGSTYTKSMAHRQPKEAFSALRVILQTYNDDSPYRDIMDFAIVRNPDMLKGRAETFMVHEDRGWIEVEDLPGNIATVAHDASYDDEGELTMELHTIYRKVYQGTSSRVDSSHYVKLTDGTYTDVHVYDWE